MTAHAKLMKLNHLQRPTAKAACAAAGLGACAVAVTLTLTTGAHPGTFQASSGDAPTNTTYAQPSVSAMNTGATATFSAPGTEPAVVSASPTFKATPYG
jgi:hypothetical protein